MAAGDSLLIFPALANEPPASAYATVDTRNAHVVLDFDAATDESAVFSGVMPRNYGGGGITLSLHWMASSATSGNVRWDASFERIAANDLDTDADSFAAVQSATGAVNGTSGKVTVTTIAFTNGAQMDSVVAGEAFRLKITRDANHATDDDMTGDAELIAVEMRETAA